MNSTGSPRLASSHPHCPTNGSKYPDETSIYLPRFSTQVDVRILLQQIVSLVRWPIASTCAHCIIKATVGHSFFNRMSGHYVLFTSGYSCFVNKVITCEVTEWMEKRKARFQYISYNNSKKMFVRKLSVHEKCKRWYQVSLHEYIV